MNLIEIKAAAELAKTSNAELEIWQMEISPDDVFRLVEVALAAKDAAACPIRKYLNRLALALKGIEL